MLQTPVPEQVLAPLRDIEGVEGSFIVSQTGQVLCHDMPYHFDAGTLGEVGPRASRIFEAWSLEPNRSECLLRFIDHKLYMRGIDGAVLCALVTPDVHLTGMRTAAQLVGRRLGEWYTEQREAKRPARVAPPPLPLQTPVPPPPAGALREPTRRQVTEPSGRTKRVRVYRGQRFEY